MALRITNLCVNCWACLPLCPSDAIAAKGPERPHFAIAAAACTECEGDFAEPQCASICPVEEAIVDAAGRPLNPRGSLTGIPPDRLEDARAAIRARQDGGGARTAAAPSTQPEQEQGPWPRPSSPSRTSRSP